MEYQETIKIKTYLERKGIKYRETNGELITQCVFNDCDKDSKGNEAHLYINSDTSQYNCKKCNAQGNIFTMAEYFGDQKNSLFLNQNSKNKLYKKTYLKAKEPLYYDPIPQHILKYLNNRGITNQMIKQHNILYAQVYGKKWIIIPVPDKNGKLQFLHLRKDPFDKTKRDKFCVLKKDKDSPGTLIFGFSCLKDNDDYIVICEGEFDCILLQSHGVSSITSTGGAGTFKDEWLDHLKDLKKIYVCFDKDDTGVKEAEKLINRLIEHFPEKSIYNIPLPKRMPRKTDITDYFIDYNGNVDELMYELPKFIGGRKDINTSQFKQLDSLSLNTILGLTIKKDEINKLVGFLCQLSAYTDDSQFNISFNAPSSTGKSYIPMEIAMLFPEKDVVELGYCTPQAFFHDTGEYDKEKNQILINLERKILIFLDQPHNKLLERLRPLLSHDKKEIQSKLTDKTQKGGNKTKNVIIRGFPAVTFCSAGLKIDEQESTRFLLLSPETNQEKIREAIHEKLKKESNKLGYKDWLEKNPDRILLKDRILTIKYENITDIQITESEYIEQKFLEKKEILKPRHQRDIGRLISLIKAFTLLNLWFRDREGNTIFSSKDDIDEAFSIWEKLAEPQEYNLPPYIFNLYKEIIVPAYNKKNITPETKLGLERKEIIKKHYEVYGRMLDDWRLRNQIIPMLDTAGLITQEKDTSDGRKILVYPIDYIKNNSETDCGVEIKPEQQTLIENLPF